MEKINSNICNICYTINKKENIIKFDCNHFFCIKCFLTISPIQMMARINLGIRHDFFNNDDIELSCVQCQKGKYILTNDLLEIIINNNFKELTKPYNKTKNCLCTGVIDRFCFNCHKEICKNCASNYHYNHQIQNIDEQFLQKTYEIFKEIKPKYNNICNEFKLFYDKTLKSWMNQKENNKNTLLKIIDDIVERLNKLKKELFDHEKNNSTNLKKLINKLDFIKLSVDNIFGNQIENLPINLIYRLKDLNLNSILGLDLKNLQFLTLEKHQIHLTLTNFIEELFNNLNEMSPNNKEILRNEIENENGGVLLQLKLRNLTKFLANPQILCAGNDEKKELNKPRQPIHIIQNETMNNLNNFKQNLLTMFEKYNRETLRNEIYFAYGIKNNDHLGDIEIYNYSCRKTEIILDSHFKEISKLATFDNYLYSCAEDIKVFDIDDFSLQFQFYNTYNNERIRSTVIFNDIYNELTLNVVDTSKWGNTADNLVVVYSINDKKSPIFMSNLINGQVIKYFDNIDNSICRSLSTFISEKNEKIYLILGFMDFGIVKILDIKNGDILYKYRANIDLYVSSIKIELEENDEIIYLTLTNYPNCSVFKGLLEKDSVYKTQQIRKLAEKTNLLKALYEIELWNKKYILLCGCEHYMVLDRNTLDIVQKSEKFMNYLDITCIVKFKEFGNRECYAILCRDEQKIRIYGFND